MDVTNRNATGKKQGNSLKECKIIHCPKIRSVYLGVSSFGCYSSLLLLDLPSLQSLHLGKFCFECMTKFNLQGMELPTNSLMH